MKNCYHFVHTILSIPFCPHHFVEYHCVRVPFCPYHCVEVVPFRLIPFCPVTLLTDWLQGICESDMVSVLSYLSFQLLADTCRNLHAAFFNEAFYQPVYTYVLNPKSITMGELYGEVNKLTLEWRDGLMGLTIRRAVQVCMHKCRLICKSVVIRSTNLSLTLSLTLSLSHSS